MAFYEQMNNVQRFFGPAGVLNIFPILRYIPNIRNSFRKVVQALDAGARFVAEFIKERDLLGEQSEILDYTDAFLKIKNKERRTFGEPKFFTGKYRLLYNRYSTSVFVKDKFSLELSEIVTE